MKTYTDSDLDYEDEPEDVNCPHCLDRGYKVRLGGRILEPNEPRPADYDSWLQCPTCLWVCPIHEVPKEEEIKDSIETIESPFEQGKFILESIPKRSSPKGKRISAKKRHNKLKLHEDNEIDALMRIYGDRVNVVHDSNP